MAVPMVFFLLRRPNIELPMSTENQVIKEYFLAQYRGYSWPLEPRLSNLYRLLTGFALVFGILGGGGVTTDVAASKKPLVRGKQYYWAGLLYLFTLIDPKEELIVYQMNHPTLPAIIME